MESVFQFLLRTAELPLALLMMVVEPYSLMVTQANSVELNLFSSFIDCSLQLLSPLQCERSCPAALCCVFGEILMEDRLLFLFLLENIILKVLF